MTLMCHYHFIAKMHNKGFQTIHKVQECVSWAIDWFKKSSTLPIHWKTSSKKKTRGVYYSLQRVEKP